jgi:hypothetical protein
VYRASWLSATLALAPHIHTYSVCGKLLYNR